MKKFIFLFTFMFLVNLWQIQVNAEIVDSQEVIMPNSCIGPNFCLEPDPGGGGGGDKDETSKWLDLEVGFYKTFGYFTEYGEQHYYYFTAAKDGYYNFHVKSDDLFGYKIGLDISLSEHKVDGNTIFYKSYYSEYYYDSYNNDNQYYFNQGEEYSLIISNSSMEPYEMGKYYLEIEVRDDNSDANKTNIDALPGGQVDSTIDYEGDVDYYTFTAQEDGVWGYKVTGILNADISIICNDSDILYSNPFWTQYGSANYTLTNSEFFAFKEGGHYTIKIKGSNIGTYSINKYNDIGMQTIELNSKSFSTSVIYSYPGYIDGYQGYKIGYFVTKDKAKLFIDSLSGGTLVDIGHYGIGVIVGAISTNALGFATDTLILLDNFEKLMFLDYAKQQIDEVDSEGIYIALRLENGSVSRYQMTIGPWDQNTYYYSDVFYYDYRITTDVY